MPDHSPAPWRVSTTPSAANDYNILSAEGTWIASVWAHKGDMRQSSPIDEASANLALVLGAPALRAALAVASIRVVELEQENTHLIVALQEIMGCLDAAQTEGLDAKLADEIQAGRIEPGSIYDLVTRRLMPAFDLASAALTTGVM